MRKGTCQVPRENTRKERTSLESVQQQPQKNKQKHDQRTLPSNQVVDERRRSITKATTEETHTRVTNIPMMTSIRSFKAFLVLSVVTIMTTLSNAEISSFLGEWKVLEAFDTFDGSIPRELPSSLSRPLIFKMTVSEKNPTDTLDLAFRVGNSMRTSVKITEESSDASASIHIGSVMSTMMMPPQDQYQFEMFLSGALPKMTAMALGSDGQELVLTGESKIVLEAVDTSSV